MLETKRMFLKKMTMDDVSDLQKIFSDPIAMQYYPKTFNEEETKAWIEKVLDNYEKHNAGMWMCYLKETSEFVGQCGLHFHSNLDGRDEVEVGYLFVRAFWGQGLATEAAKAVMTYAKEKLDVHRLISLVRPENNSSKRVAEKNDLTPEKEIIYKGLRHIVYVYEL